MKNRLVGQRVEIIQRKLLWKTKTGQWLAVAKGLEIREHPEQLF